jgi:hypothetical protein
MMQLALNVVLAMKVDVANLMHESAVNFYWFTIAFQLMSWKDWLMCALNETDQISGSML